MISQYLCIILFALLVCKGCSFYNPPSTVILCSLLLSIEGGIYNPSTQSPSSSIPTSSIPTRRPTPKPSSLPSPNPSPAPTYSPTPFPTSLIAYGSPVYIVMVVCLTAGVVLFIGGPLLGYFNPHFICPPEEEKCTPHTWTPTPVENKPPEVNSSELLQLPNITRAQTADAVIGTFCNCSYPLCKLSS